ARNNREWQQLIEVCRVVDTVLIDHDSVYDSRNSNDRLLLGLKGSLNEYELDLLRLRSQEARKEKARRGELIVSVPIGFIKSNDIIEKDPDLRIQKAIGLVFRKFLELGSIRQTLYWFIDNGVKIPSRRLGQQIEWKRPLYTNIMCILKNPIYAGIYAYGKTKVQSIYEDGKLKKKSRSVAVNDWLAFIEDHHEGHIEKEIYYRIQNMIAENSQIGSTNGKGAAKQGAALLVGLIRCKRCGRKLVVKYTGRDKDSLRYSCQRGFLDIGEAKCIDFSGSAVDIAVVNEIMKIIQPAGIEAASLAHNQFQQEKHHIIESLELELQQVRYTSQRVWKQYDLTDPENRLVAAELERRWNNSLEQVRLLERQLEEERNKQEMTSMPDTSEILGLSSKLKTIWNHTSSDAKIKKRIIRTLIEEIVADIDPESGLIDIVIHWKGGIHSELHIRRRKRGFNGQATSMKAIEALKELAKVCSDETIASTLNRNGYRTGHDNRWNKERVKSCRLKRKIPKCTQEKKTELGWMNLTEASRYLGVSGPPLCKAVESGNLKGSHPLPDGPWIFNKSDLDTPKTSELIEEIKGRRRKTPVKQNADQLTLFKEKRCSLGVV
ncbi:MAG: recombinase family protein, partial [Candidatus Marinimicrobia bacterium]|nr:recombinase family protein [Candidatus Neomarinimicrobiota bacterium]